MANAGGCESALAMQGRLGRGGSSLKSLLLPAFRDTFSVGDVGCSFDPDRTQTVVEAAAQITAQMAVNHAQHAATA